MHRSLCSVTPRPQSAATRVVSLICHCCKRSSSLGEWFLLGVVSLGGQNGSWNARKCKTTASQWSLVKTKLCQSGKNCINIVSSLSNRNRVHPMQATAAFYRRACLLTVLPLITQTRNNSNARLQMFVIQAKCSLTYLTSCIWLIKLSSNFFISVFISSCTLTLDTMALVSGECISVVIHGA